MAKRKIDPILSELKKIEKKIDLVEESVNLGTFDMTILAIMVFIVATALSLISLNAYSFLIKIPPLAVTFAYLVMFAGFVVILFYWYVGTIFKKDEQFKIKCICLAIFQAMGLFLALLLIILFIGSGYEMRFGNIPDFIDEILAAVIPIVSIIYGIQRYFKNMEYVKENFKNITERRLEEIVRKQINNEKSLKNNGRSSILGKSFDWAKWQTIGTFVLAIIALFGLIISVYAAVTANKMSDKSNEIAEKSLDLLPSKYAELRISTPTYTYISFPLNKIMDGEDGIYLYIENMGGQDSGPVEIRTNDAQISGKSIEFQNLPRGQFNTSILWLNSRSMENPETKLLTKQNLTLEIRCARCEKQGEQKVFDICIYNQSVTECRFYGKNKY